MQSQEQREKLVAGALAFTTGSAIEAGEYERSLLEKYVQGILTIEEVIILLKAAQPPV